MSEEIVIDGANDVRAAVIVAAEVVKEHLGLELSTDKMPDPHKHHFFSWMRGRKWFDLDRVRRNVRSTLRSQGLATPDWEGIFYLLIPEITHVCFEEGGAIVTSPWNDGYDF
jgi:hypothetical protein